MKNLLMWVTFAGGVLLSSHAEAKINNKSSKVDTQTSLCTQNTRDRIAIIVQGQGGESTQGKIALCNGKDQEFISRVTTGKPHEDGGVWTPEWHFLIQWMEKNRVSKTYNNAPMPYAMHIFRWIFFHEWKVGDKYSSHGCVRLPNGKAKSLYELVEAYQQGNTKVHVIINNTNPNK